MMAKLSEPVPAGFHEAWPSPDGAFLAGHFQTATGERMMVVPTAGGRAAKVPDHPAECDVGSGRPALVFYSGRGGFFNMFRQSIDGGAVTPMTQFTSEQIFAYALSPDQKQLAVVRGRVSSDVVLVRRREGRPEKPAAPSP